MSRKIGKTLACSLLLAALPAAHAEAQQVKPAFFGGILTPEDRRVMDEARARIETERKRRVTLKLLGGAGQPSPAGTVEIALVRHDFPFGVNAGRSHKEEKFADKIETVSAGLFNRLVGGSFWGEMQKQKDGPYDFSFIDYKLRLAEKLGMDSRYHAVFYFREGNIPPRWSSEVASSDEWWRLMEQHVKAIGDRYGDQFTVYDVHNEMLYHQKWRASLPALPDVTRPETAARMLQLARKHLQGKLILLDHFYPADDAQNPKFGQYYDYVKAVIAMGAPLDGVGYQGHFFTPASRSAADLQNYRMATISRGLDKLATLGVPVHITEYSSPGWYVKNERGQAKQRRETRPAHSLSRAEMAAFAVNFYTLAFSKPYVAELDRWYVVDTFGGRGQDVGLIDLQGSLTPEYHALHKLLKETWTTKVRDVLRDGTVSFTGFYGTYQVSVNGKPFARFKLERGGADRIEVQRAG
jgi:GH35 family endo-1,4-beta-xylanase